MPPHLERFPENNVSVEEGRSDKWGQAPQIPFVPLGLLTPNPGSCQFHGSINSL